MMTPLRYRVRQRLVETADTVTLVLDPVDEPIVAPLPGQFTMMYAFGVGEVPISVSGHVDGAIVHTIRDVGAVTGALTAADKGQVLGIRGPYGTDWGVPAGGDLVVMAGGIGLAPLRPVIRQAVADRTRYRRVVVLVGARTPGGPALPRRVRQVACRRPGRPRDGPAPYPGLTTSDSGRRGEAALAGPYPTRRITCGAPVPSPSSSRSRGTSSG
jgi:NAD(P)H-flavin reductase